MTDARYDDVNHVFSFYACGVTGAMAGVMIISVAREVERKKSVEEAEKAAAEAGEESASKTPQMKRRLSEQLAVCRDAEASERRPAMAPIVASSPPARCSLFSGWSYFASR